MKDLASSLHSLGIDLSNIARYEDALHAYEEAVVIRRRLAESDPTLGRNLAGSLQNLGFGLNVVGSRNEDAVPINEEAVSLYLKLPETNHTASVANTLKNLGRSLRAVGRHEDASHAYEHGAEIYRRLAEVDPGSAAQSLHEVALEYHSVGFHDDALDTVDGAVKLYRKLAQMNHIHVKNLIESLQLLAKVLRALGREEDAARADVEVTTLNTTSSGQESGSFPAPGESQRLLSLPAVNKVVGEEEANNVGEGQDSPRAPGRDINPEGITVDAVAQQHKASEEGPSSGQGADRSASTATPRIEGNMEQEGRNNLHDHPGALLHAGEPARADPEVLELQGTASEKIAIEDSLPVQSQSISTTPPIDENLEGKAGNSTEKNSD
ncbi:hypothetical protein DFH09DRAFT_1143246, partial [Mycena vulgaris]